MRELSVLRGLGSSQKKIERYLTRQERLFNKLKKDIKNERIKPGISKRKIISIYGEPILSKKSPRGSLKTVLLYRRPKEYFSSDKVYLYFDKANKLIRWEYGQGK